MESKYRYQLTKRAELDLKELVSELYMESEIYLKS